MVTVQYFASPPKPGHTNQYKNDSTDYKFCPSNRNLLAWRLSHPWAHLFRSNRKKKIKTGKGSLEKDSQ